MNGNCQVVHFRGTISPYRAASVNYRAFSRFTLSFSLDLLLLNPEKSPIIKISVMGDLLERRAVQGMGIYFQS